MSEMYNAGRLFADGTTKQTPYWLLYTVLVLLLVYCLIVTIMCTVCLFFSVTNLYCLGVTSVLFKTRRTHCISFKTTANRARVQISLSQRTVQYSALVRSIPFL